MVIFLACLKGDETMKIGLRVIKTGIAVAITMFVCNALKLEPAFFGAVSAVINMQPSIFLSLKTALNQILVHVIGVVLGFFFGYFFGVNPISAGLIVILLIPIYIKFNLHSGITMGIVGALFVLSSSTEEFIYQALVRSGVIFVGLTTAMLVNVVLWPPRHSKRFKEILKESNEAAVQYFCCAVREFVCLEESHLCFDKKERERVYNLNKEASMLLDLMSREQKLLSEGEASKEWLFLAKKLTAYNDSIIKKGDRIFDLIPLRTDRRLQMANPQVSQEFKEILKILESGCTIVIRMNEKLRTVIIEKKAAIPEKISEEYWASLTMAIEKWQPISKESKYIHALMEISVTASEIKWATRQAKILVYEGLHNK